MISAWYAVNTVLTFALQPRPSSYWESTFRECQEKSLPFLVAVPNEAQTTGDAVDDSESSGLVLGFCLAHPYRGGLGAYKHTAELTLFLSPLDGVMGKGIGSALLESLENTLSKHGEIQQLVGMAAVVPDIEKATKLKRFYLERGFREVGVLEKVGRKFGNWIDVGIFQKGIEVKSDN